MQAHTTADPGHDDNRRYHAAMARKLSRQRPAQGAHLFKLREAVGLTQKELADLVGETQVNISFWERCEKPPRSDVLPRMAKVLGVSLEDLLSPQSSGGRHRRGGPVGKLQRVFERASMLPRSQQDKLVDLIGALVETFERRGTST